MKRLHLSLLILAIVQLAALNISAQSQRLAIPPASFSLAKRAASYDVKAYCLDRHLLIGQPVDFTAVLAGNARVVRVGDRPLMTLKEAIDGGFMRVKGAGLRDRNYSAVSGTQVKFISTTDEPININFTQTVAIGERGSNPVSLNTLASVRKSASEEDFRTVQDELWFKEIDETRLEALGFYGPGKTARTRLTTKNAVLGFQRKYGLPRTGILNSATKRALEEAELEEIDAFERIGFKVRRTDTSVAHVVDNIRAFGEFTDPNTASTGRLTDTLRLKVDSFREEFGFIVRQALAVDRSSALPSDATLLRDNPNIITFERDRFLTKDGDPLALTNVLLETPKGVELWGIENGTLTRRASGEKAIFELDSYLQATARIPIDSRTVTVRTGAYKTGGMVPLHLGDVRIDLSPEEMQQFISGTISQAKINAAIDRLSAGRSSKLRVVVVRSPFSQGRSGSLQDAGVLSLYGYKEQEPLALARALERDYNQKIDVFVASDRMNGAANLRNLPKLTEGSQIGFYVDDNFKYSSKIIDPIKKDLQKAQIRVLKVGEAATPDTRIFIFAGHRDEAYQQLVLKLADEGRFRNGIIVQTVCGASCDGQFNSLLISKSGARAVISHEPDINAQAVQDVIMKFAELSSKEGAPNGNYQELWLKSVDQVEKTADPSLKDEVKKLRRIVIQVSRLQHTSMSANGE